MVKNRLLLLLFFSTTWVQGDFLESRVVGPDIIHHHEFIAQGPWHIQVLEVDLTNPNVRIETIKAGDQLEGYERTSQMASRSDSEAHRVVGAINGDFYGNAGVPIGAQVCNGSLIKREYPRSAFGIGPENEPFIDILSFSASVSKNGEVIAPIHTVNAQRDQDRLVVYNAYMGSRTETNNWGTEIVCAWIDAPLVNRSRRAVALEKDSTLAAGTGNNLIPQNGFVLSGHGTSRLAIDSSIFVGDTLSLYLGFDPIQHAISQLIGGAPRLIREGAISVEWSQESVGSSFTYDRHPRTAVGFTADSSKLYLVTVDGRQPGYSVGMSLPELANYMFGWGMAEAVNLDGGGSTTMVVRGDLANSPSDAGGERSVGNALLVINTAPTGDLAHLNIIPGDFYTLVGAEQSMTAQGYDSTYNPIDLDPDVILWSCDPILGSIDSLGVFTAGSMPGEGIITGSVGSVTDTAWVRVTQVDSIALSPAPIVLELGQHQQMQARAYDPEGNQLNLGNGDFQWWVTPEIGVINNLGYFSAYHYGSGLIKAGYGSVEDSVTVFVGSSQAVTFDDFTTVDQWSLTGAVVDITQCTLSVDHNVYLSAPSSGKLDYALTAGGTSVLYLNCQIPISGTPETVFLDIFGDGEGHWMRGEFLSSTGDRFLVNFTEADPGIDWTGSWRTVQVNLADAIPHWGNPAAFLTFPITWTKLYLAETDEASKNSGTLYLDNFGVSYLTTDIDPEPQQLSNMVLTGPYPNPFNAQTHFEIVVPYDDLLTVTIFDIQGRQIFEQRQAGQQGRVHVTWDASKAPSGIYVYHISMGGEQRMGKCLLVK